MFKMYVCCCRIADGALSPAAPLYADSICLCLQMRLLDDIISVIERRRSQAQSASAAAAHPSHEPAAMPPGAEPPQPYSVTALVFPLVVLVPCSWYRVPLIADWCS